MRNIQEVSLLKCPEAAVSDHFNLWITSKLHCTLVNPAYFQETMFAMSIESLLIPPLFQNIYFYFENSFNSHLSDLSLLNCVSYYKTQQPGLSVRSPLGLSQCGWSSTYSMSSTYSTPTPTLKQLEYSYKHFCGTSSSYCVISLQPYYDPTVNLL